ncbi:MAG TPA: hypothetical protein VGH40_11770 [Roseiarcus sp.]|jgi:hypothetical protein
MMISRCILRAALAACLALSHPWPGARADGIFNPGGTIPFSGDNGSGGKLGAVPAPGAGAAASNEVLGAGGSWVGQAAGFRNRLIDGDFRISQRNGANAFSSGTTAGTYGGSDRWYVSAAGAAVTLQQVAGDAPNQYALQITGAALNTGVAFGQRVEASNIFDQEGLTDTLQIRAKCSAITTLNWAAYYPGATDNWSSRTLIASGSWTISASYVNYNTNIALTAAIETGLEIEFSVGAMTSGTCDFENAQLEPGSVATAFERQPVQTELAQCQRYYALLTYGAQSPAMGTLLVPLFWPVPMRATPTLTVISVGTALNLSSISDLATDYRGGNFSITTSAANGYSIGRVAAVSAEL